MTWAEVRRGEVWRLVTATFVHFSLLHVGMNVFGLIKLGQLIEPWYRAGPFLAVCLAIGGLGNLVGGLLRQAITFGRVALTGTRLAQAWPDVFAAGGPDGMSGSFLIPSGGGSTILLGLLGLGAVVGWRSSTRIGSFLRDQMVTMLAFTAVLGFLLINLIDNYGHAGGAVVGAGFGFLHRPLFRTSERSPAFRGGCWAFAGVLSLACLVALVRDDRAEASFRAEFLATARRYELDQVTLGDLDQVSIAYARLVLLTIEVHNPYGELDLIGLDPLLKAITTAPLPPARPPLAPEQVFARTRAELAAAPGVARRPARVLVGRRDRRRTSPRSQPSAGPCSMRRRRTNRPTPLSSPGDPPTGPSALTATRRRPTASNSNARFNEAGTAGVASVRAAPATVDDPRPDGDHGGGRRGLRGARLA